VWSQAEVLLDNPDVESGVAEHMQRPLGELTVALERWEAAGMLPEGIGIAHLTPNLRDVVPVGDSFSVTHFR
jgi:hypothetical protein